jgi:hypothetical protein
MNEKKIRKRTELHSLVDANDKIKTQFKRGFQEFDERGNLLKDVVFKPNGEIESALGFRFDDKDRLIEEIHYYEGGDTGERILFKLDEEGNRVEIETTYADESKSIKKIARFENMVSIKTYDEDGDFESEDLIKHNDKGNVIEELSYDEDRKIVKQDMYEYDEENRLHSKTEYAEDNEFIVKILVDYDDRGNIVSETRLNRKNELLGKTTFEYDEKGNRIAWQNNHHRTLTTYNSNGKPIKEEVFNGLNGLTESFTEYRYDDQELLAEERTFTLGDQYELEPGVLARTQSAFIVTGYKYEYID